MTEQACSPLTHVILHPPSVYLSPVSPLPLSRSLCHLQFFCLCRVIFDRMLTEEYHAYYKCAAQPLILTVILPTPLIKPARLCNFKLLQVAQPPSKNCCRLHCPCNILNLINLAYLVNKDLKMKILLGFRARQKSNNVLINYESI